MRYRQHAHVQVKCVKTTNFSGPPSPQKKRDWYYMITSGDQGICRDRNMSCSDENIAPWGSIQPVYSHTTNLVYKNKVCAQCNGVTDTVFYETYISCTGNPFGLQLSAVLSGHVKWNIDCIVNFYPPEGTGDLHEHRCYDGMSVKCPDTFQMPEYLEHLNVSKEQVKRLCEEGFHSPLLNQVLYVNPICHMCNNRVNIKQYSNQECEVQSYMPRFPISASITMLLNPEISIYSRQQKNTKTHTCAKRFHSQVSYCQPLHIYV